MTRQRRQALTLVLLVVAALGAAALHLAIAREGPGPQTVWHVLCSCFGGGDVEALDRETVLGIRLPRLIVAAAGGAALGLAGCVLQASFRNPLASPDIVGTSAGAAFGGALAIVTGIARVSTLIVPVASLAGAAGVTWLVFLLAGAHRRFSVTGLLLAGIALNTLVGAATAFVVTFTFDTFTASNSVLFWLMGGLTSRNWNNAAITAGGLVAFGSMLAVRGPELDLMTLSDDSAHSLGLDVERSRRWFLWCGCGLTASTIANTGGIAFLGLVVPHLARLLTGPAHRRLLPASALLGAVLLVLADFVCRIAPPDANLRLGVIISALGAPYFLWLLARHRRGEELQ